MEVGPWGGKGGAAWDDGVYNGVREIKLIYGQCIDSIQVVYDENGKPIEAEKHGGVGGNHTTEIKLRYPEEYLVNVSGYIHTLMLFIGPVIKSLTLKTNKRTFGPFGMEEGTPFSFPVEGNRIVGFKGRSGWYLDAIGFHVCQVQPPRLLQQADKKSMEVGPWGGNGGDAWDDGVYNGVREIRLIYGQCIDSIQVVYDENGKPIEAEKHGGVGGDYTTEIKLRYPDEYLVNVSGYIYTLMLFIGPVIRSLTFKTNKRTFGPFGIEEGTPFSFPVEGNRIVGFKGRSGWYLDAIGFHVCQVQPSRLLQQADKKIMEVGPWGGNDGDAWDDGVYNGVREIRLIYGQCIDSIQVVYDENGKPIEAEKHGGVGGNHTTKIKLLYPDEYLVNVSGHIYTLILFIGPVIRSLTLKTNKRTFGPFGMEEGIPFSFPVEGNRIVGFKGRSGWYLDAIGFHVCQVQPPRLLQRVNKKSMEVGPWGGNGGAAWDDGVYNGVREIRLIYGQCIDSIQVVYDENGKPVEAKKHGGAGGNHTTEIKLRYPDEYLVNVSGYIYTLMLFIGPVIRSLTFKTNKRTFGPFGMEKGKPFSFPVEGNRIVGFKGRSGWYLDAIGFHVF